MFVIMGGTGQVGGATASALLDDGEAVTIVTRDARAASPWHDRGAEIAEADIDDVDSLRAAFRRGTRALLLNPVANPADDSDAVETRTGRNIVAALDGSGLEKVVLQSTYGAQPGEHLADLGTLWALEQLLAQQPIPVAINRGAYFLANWAMYLDAIRGGVLPSLYPADLVLPMVAPVDLGEAAAERLRSSIEDVGVRSIEGPARWSANDVAAAFARALGRRVEVDVTPRDRWVASLIESGFSESSARSFANMTAVTVDAGSGDPALPDTADVYRGRVSLEQFVQQLVDAT